LWCSWTPSANCRGTINILGAAAWTMDWPIDMIFKRTSFPLNIVLRRTCKDSGTYFMLSWRFLIDTLNSLGFCSSYAEIQKFECCAAAEKGNDIPILLMRAFCSM
jgi:hypothetical protein